MKTNALGRTDLAVTEICLGTMTWGQQNTEAEAHAQIDYALDAGVNFMDTAEMYPIPGRAETQGLTETYIGTWFKSRGQRDRWVLASKIAGGRNQPWIRGGAPATGSSVREALEGSLRRLQTDYVDLYQIHWPSRPHYHFDQGWDFHPETEDGAQVLETLHGLLTELKTLVDEGKIRHVGVSNESAWGIMQYLRLAEQHGLPRLVSVQNEYGLLKRQFDHDLAELAHYENVGLLAYSALAAGALTGKYLDGVLPQGSRGAISGGVWRNNAHSEPVIRKYLTLAQRHDVDIAQLGLAFCLTKPFMTSVIIGATTMDQLKTNIAAAEITLSAELLADIEALHRDHPRPF